ncbi:hypothetical protein [Caulobacter hibisci]|uniref:Uncharacterized protein n=1 Tax=Caulobacter hibisci TaxID=2035993 RepID=A0ABS0SUJ5_9CAUL|nr:hypothetical protein [Caulobacter hibisci]MBI1683288.1 hypothetical protein [Caulobacter hibisci]
MKNGSAIALEAVVVPTVRGKLGAAGIEHSGEGWVFYTEKLDLEPGFYVFDLAYSASPGSVLQFEAGLVQHHLNSVELDPSAEAGELPVALSFDSPLEVRLYCKAGSVVVSGLSYRRIDTVAYAQNAGRNVGADLGEFVFGHILGARPVHGSRPELPSPVVPGDDLAAAVREHAIYVSQDEIYYQRDQLIGAGVDPVLARALLEDSGYDFAFERDRHVETGLMGYPKTQHLFQTMIIRDGELSFISPVTGRKVTAQASIPLAAGGFMPVVYEVFDDEAPMILVGNAGWGGGISYVWFIRQNIILHDNRNWCIGFAFADLMRHYFSICLNRRDEVAAYRAKSKVLTILSGYIPNMGHYFWNDVSGLEREFRAGRLQGKPVFAQARLWLPPEVLYPEIAADVETVPSPDVLTRVLREGRFVVRASASAVDAPMADRLLARSRDQLAASDPARFAEIERLAAEKDFCLLVPIRAHNKVWVEQVEGVVAVIDLLKSRYENLLVYLDGTPDCQGVVDQIIAARGEAATIVAGVNVSFAETVIWSFVADFYVASVGGGLVPVTSFSDKPGVCHANYNHWEHIDLFWRRVRPSDQPLLLVPRESIRDLEGDDHPSGIYSNYTIDPQVVTALVEKGLDLMKGESALRARA